MSAGLYSKLSLTPAPLEHVAHSIGRVLLLIGRARHWAVRPHDVGTVRLECIEPPAGMVADRSPPPGRDLRQRAKFTSGVGASGDNTVPAARFREALRWARGQGSWSRRNPTRV